MINKFLDIYKYLEPALSSLNVLLFFKTSSGLIVLFMSYPSRYIVGLVFRTLKSTFRSINHHFWSNKDYYRTR